MLTTPLSSSIEGLMGLWEEQPSSSFKGLEFGNESPPFKWEWFSIARKKLGKQKLNKLETEI